MSSRTINVVGSASEKQVLTTACVCATFSKELLIIRGGELCSLCPGLLLQPWQNVARASFSRLDNGTLPAAAHRATRCSEILPRDKE